MRNSKQRAFRPMNKERGNTMALTLFFASILGILGTLLFFYSTEGNRDDFRVIQSNVNCDHARHQRVMGLGSRKELMEREAKACGEADKRVAIRDADEIANKKVQDELKEGAERFITNQNGEADKTEKVLRDAARDAASAVVDTAKTVKQIAK